MRDRKGSAIRPWSMGVAIALIAGLSYVFPFSPPTLRAEEVRDAKRVAPGLVAAIRDGDVKAVADEINRGADVNARDAEGNTPLILAAFYASPQCVAFLLGKGADPNAANKAGVTALIRAATDYEKTRLLLDAGAKVGERTADLGNTPLMLAARRAGNSRTVRLLLERGANALEHSNFGVSPILAGAASGDLDTVRSLLDAGAKSDDFPEQQDPNAALAAGFRTPLMWAAYHNDVPMVRLLLERGADPNRSTFFGTPLSHASWNDAFEAAEVLLERGAKVNARDTVADFTPLHWAAGSERLQPHLINLLLAGGADPNAAGGEPVGALGLVPQTPRLIAERRGHTAIVDALVAAGAREESRSVPIARPHRAVREPLEEATVIASAEKALAALQQTAARSREAFVRHVSKQDCVSCHQQYLPMMAVGHARSRSIRFDRNAAREQIDSLMNRKDPISGREFLAQTLFHPGPAQGLGYELLALSAEGIAPSAMTDGAVHHLVTIQALDGRWINNLPRPPMMADDVSATALSVYAIKHYGWRGREAEFTTSVEQARRWLWTVSPVTNEEAAFQLLGLRWAGEPLEKLACLAGSLRNRQREDGGWSQLPTLESDAYATGEALYALAQVVKDPATDPAWQRGLRYLLETQEDDGTWHVARRAFPFQPTMNSGFSHHRDSWISAAATSWAVLALTQAAPSGPAAGRPAVAQSTTPPRTAKNAPRIEFARQVKPLLERSCVACHSGERPRGLFRVDGRDHLLKGGASGEAAVVPGHSEESPLVEYVSGSVTDFEMPPRTQRRRFPALGADDLDVLRAWIDQGAEWPADVSLTVPKVANVR